MFLESPRLAVLVPLDGDPVRRILRAHPEPSGADRALTQRLKEALGLVDVRVLDHVIVAGTDTTSFAERGLI